MKKMWNYLKVKISSFLEPEPELEIDYIDKVVYLLRRDFNSKEQNKILKEVATKLSNLRDQDMIRLEQEYITLKQHTNDLKSLIA